MSVFDGNTPRRNVEPWPEDRVPTNNLERLIASATPYIDKERDEAERARADAASRCRAEGGVTSNNENSDLAAKAPAAQADYTVDDSELARKIMVFLGRAKTDSMEPGADPLRDRLAERLALWRPAATPASPAPTLESGLREILSSAKGSRNWYIADLARECIRLLGGTVTEPASPASTPEAAPEPIYQIKSVIHPHGWHDTDWNGYEWNKANGQEVRIVYAAPTAVAATTSEDARDAAPVISSYDIEKVKALKFKFVDALIHGGIQYRTCGAISAVLNRIIDDSEAATLRATQQEGGNG